MDCSMYMIPFCAQKSAGEYGWDEILDVFLKISSDEVYAMLTTLQESIDLKVVSTVSLQLVAVKASRDGIGNSILISDAKNT